MYYTYMHVCTYAYTCKRICIHICIYQRHTFDTGSIPTCNYDYIQLDPLANIIDSRGMFSPAYSTYQNPNDSFLNDNTTERSWYFNPEQTNYKKSPFINDIIYYLKYGNISEDENPNDNPILRDPCFQTPFTLANTSFANAFFKNILYS